MTRRFYSGLLRRYSGLLRRCSGLLSLITVLGKVRRADDRSCFMSEALRPWA